MANSVLQDKSFGFAVRKNLNRWIKMLQSWLHY